MEELFGEEIISLLRSLDQARERGDIPVVKAYSEAILNLTNALTMAYGGQPLKEQSFS